VQNVARGAALMSDCKVEIVFDKACSNLLQDSTLNQVLHARLLAEGALTVDAETQAKAELLEWHQGKPYACPIPIDVPPPFFRSLFNSCRRSLLGR